MVSNQLLIRSAYTYLWAFFALLFVQVAAEGYDPVALYLTWQRSPETTMSVQWITHLDREDDTIEYQKEGDTGWISAVGVHTQLPEQTPYFIHMTELKNLEPSTTYIFRTGNDGEIYKFKTMPKDLSKPIKFVAGGDMYHDTLEVLHATNKQAAKTSPDFALVGGDIAYAADKLMSFLPRWSHPYVDKWYGQKFERWLSWLIAWKEDMVTPEGLMIPMLPAIGNHDTSGRYDQTPAQAPFFYALFPMPGSQGYNVIDFGNYMSIFLLDTGHTHPIAGKQAQWLAQNLSQRQTIPHKFALYHVPAYPSVHKFTEAVGAEVRKHWVPSFDAYQLTAAFEHHEHSYKRTYPIKKGIVDKTGVVYIGDGGWGVDKPRKPRHLDQKWYLANAISARHFILVTVEKSNHFAQAINSDGIIIDQFPF